MNNNDAIKVEKWLQDMFSTHGSYDSVYVEKDQLIIENVEGDWKHTHCFLDTIMKNLGYECVQEISLDNDDEVVDDWGRSTHIYEKIKEKK